MFEIPTPNEHLANRCSILNFMESAAIERDSLPEWVSRTINPYKDDDSEIDTYQDDILEYWVDVKSHKVIQAGPRSDQRPESVKMGDKLPMAKLREIAHDIITEMIEGWHEIKGKMHPLEDNHRQEVYFFRYDDFSGPVPESELPPFIQVGIGRDGTLRSYTDTFTLSKFKGIKPKDPIINKSNAKPMESNNSIVKCIKNKDLSAEEKLLRKHGLKNDDGSYTSDYRDIVMDKIYKEREAEVVKDIKECEKENKDCKK